MYVMVCYERGIDLKSYKGRYPKVAEYQVRTDYDNFLWTEDSEPLPVCSFTAFLAFWKKTYPNIFIRPPSEDICGECLIYKNAFVDADKKKKSTEELSDIEKESDGEADSESEVKSNDSLSCATNNSKLSAESNTLNVQQQIEESEKIILDAAEHVTRAQDMREAAKEKMELAKQQAPDTPHSQKHYVFVVDYAQNLDVPHFGSSQPGYSY